MCERTNGKVTVLKKQLAWKLIMRSPDVVSGPWYASQWQEDGWSKPVIPAARPADDPMSSWGLSLASTTHETFRGYHVFRTRAHARKRLRGYAVAYGALYPIDIVRVLIRGMAIVRVFIRGKTLPFWDEDASETDRPSGYAVEQWKVKSD